MSKYPLRRILANETISVRTVRNGFGIRRVDRQQLRLECGHVLTRKMSHPIGLLAKCFKCPEVTG